MNSNNIILLIIGLISIYLIRDKLNNKLLQIILLGTFVVGIAVTKNVFNSLFIACILGSLYSLFVNNKETFKTQKKQKTKKESFKLDKKGSFYENYKALSKKQVEGLKSDTKELLTVQKELMETLQNMGPALSNSKQILETFREYFKKDKSLQKLTKTV